MLVRMDGLKNAASRRTVPVHRALLDAGFSADVLPFKSSGHYYSKRVNPWLRKVVGITDRRLSFHSTRSRIDCARLVSPMTSNARSRVTPRTERQIATALDSR